MRSGIVQRNFVWLYFFVMEFVFILVLHLKKQTQCDEAEHADLPVISRTNITSLLE